ncbi:MAG: Type 1 glutamine amidotransferase-like domain-containing protein [Candidatus Saccharimonadales bacterium]
MVVSDGWSSFGRKDGVSRAERIKQKVESVSARLWTNKYIGYILGKASINIQNLGSLDEEAAEVAIARNGILLVPGGNTFQAMRGLQRHREAIRQHVKNGKPYVGDSAGARL